MFADWWFGLGMRPRAIYLLILSASDRDERSRFEAALDANAFADTPTNTYTGHQEFWGMDLIGYHAVLQSAAGNGAPRRSGAGVGSGLWFAKRSFAANRRCGHAAPADRAGVAKELSFAEIMRSILPPPRSTSREDQCDTTRVAGTGAFSEKRSARRTLCFQ